MTDVSEQPAVQAPPGPGPLKSLGFTVLFLCLLGVVVEGAARLMTGAESEHAAQVIKIEDSYRTSPESMFALDRDLLWRPKPNYETEYKYIINLNPMVALPQTYHVKLNSRGFRGPELADPRRPIRIACLGDSVTFGLNAPDDWTYPAILQQQLDRAAPGKVEVINAGVPSYSSDHGVLWLEQVILPLDPDLVVLGYGHNDSWMHPKELRAFLAAHGQADWRATLQRILNRSAAYRALKLAVLKAKAGAAPDAVDPEKANKTFVNYERMLGLCQARGVPAVILVLYNQRAETVAQLQEAGRRFEVSVLDVRPWFERLGPAQLMSEQKHPNTRGYAVMGAWLADVLAPQLGLPKPPPLQPSAAPEDAAGAGTAADLERSVEGI